MEISSKELVAMKIPARNMQKEIKKEIGIKIVKQAKARDSKKYENLNLIVLTLFKKINILFNI